MTPDREHSIIEAQRNKVEQIFNRKNLVLGLQGNVYPPFKLWLESRTESTFEEVMKDIKDNLLPLVRYDRTQEILDADVVITEEGKVKLVYEYQNGVLSKNNGDCGELASNVALLISQKYPTIPVFVVLGNDDMFFSQEGSNHSYVIAGKPSSGLLDLLYQTYLIDPTYGYS